MVVEVNLVSRYKGYYVRASARTAERAALMGLWDSRRRLRGGQVWGKSVAKLCGRQSRVISRRPRRTERTKLLTGSKATRKAESLVWLMKVKAAMPPTSKRQSPPCLWRVVVAWGGRAWRGNQEELAVSFSDSALQPPRHLLTL